MIFEDDTFGHWLAGFIDGEGCFYIAHQKPNHHSCRFVLEVRADEAPIMEEIRWCVGVGEVRYQDRGPRGCNCKWVVGRKADCLVLVAVLDRYPLRAKKARDYATWREAVMEWCGARDQARLASLKFELSASRRRDVALAA